MKTERKVNYLLSQVQSQIIEQSFSRWYVGTSEREDIWRKTKEDMIVFNVLDQEATKAAYEQLVSAGMHGRKPLGDTPKYLYLYCMDGKLPDGFIY